jgi:hypothetical protein
MLATAESAPGKLADLRQHDVRAKRLGSARRRILAAFAQNSS